LLNASPGIVASDSTTVSKPTYKYKNGTKEIEAEGGEYVFKKVGNKYKLKYDLEGGKSHSRGGEDIIVEDKDVITPKKDRDKIAKMIGKDGWVKDNLKFNGYRLTLPKDGDKAARGMDLDKIESRKPTGVEGLTFNDSAIMDSTNPLTTPQYNNAPSQESNFNFGNYLNTAAQLAPTLYNLGEGIFGKVEREQGEFVNPQEMVYQDFSDSIRRQSNQLYNLTASNSRNLSGGNASNLRSNLNQAAAENFNRQQDINNAETSRALDVINANLGINNNAIYDSTQERRRINEINAANRGRKSQMLASGLEGLQNYALTQKQNQQVEEQNNMLLNNLETPNYKFNRKTSKWEFKNK
jgi:hypothetical protein